MPPRSPLLSALLRPASPPGSICPRLATLGLALSLLGGVFGSGLAHASCNADHLPTAFVDGRLSVQLTPGERAYLWVEEAGADLAIRSGERVIDSVPGRYALEPVTVIADQRGEGAVHLQDGHEAAVAGVTVRRRCSGATLDSLIEGIGYHRSQAVEDADVPAALQMIVHAGAALVMAKQEHVARAWILLQLASLARSGGFLAEASTAYQLAAAAAREADDPVREAWAMLGEGQALLALGRAAADAALFRARELADAAGMAFPAAIAQHDLCVWHRMRGELEEAESCFVSVATRFERMSEPRERSRALLNRATALQMLGRYGDARESLEIAAGIAPEADSRFSAHIALYRAQGARWNGHFEQSLGFLESALEDAHAGGRMLEYAHVLRLVGQTYAIIGEPSRALAYFRRSMDIYRTRGIENRASAIEAVMARVLESEGRTGEALHMLLQARKVLVKLGTATELQALLIDLARVQAVTGQVDAALETLSGLLKDEAALSWKSSAEAKTLRVRLTEADAESAEAALMPLMQSALDEGHFLLYLEIAMVLVDKRLGNGEVEEAIALASSASTLGQRLGSQLRSPGLRHAVVRRTRPLALASFAALGDGPVVRTEAEKAVTPIERLRRVEQMPTGRPPTDQLDELERWMTAESLQTADSIPEARRHALVLSIDAFSRESAEAGQPATQAAADALTLPVLSPGEALLYFVLEADAGGVLVGEAGNWTWRSDIDASELGIASVKLREVLAAGHGGLDEVATAASRVAQAMRLAELFSEPPPRLFVVADARLAGLPWDVLPSPWAMGQPLGVKTEISLLQSLQRQPERLASRVFALSASPPPGMQLASLAGAARESSVIEPHWKNGLPLTKSLADQGTLTSALATEGAIVHVAAHGSADTGFAEESGLWVSDAATNSIQFVSTLRLREVPQSASLVVLSACEGAHAIASRSIGVGGVAGSMVDAGSQAVISSLWQVSDRAALAFADALHDSLARTPNDPGRALQEAKTVLMSSPAFRHPHHWAGWILLRSGPPPNSS
jgi:tetratricopeptide (TPR) repeat protein